MVECYMNRYPRRIGFMKMNRNKLIAVNALCVSFIVMFMLLPPIPGMPFRLAAFAIVPIVLSSIITGKWGALITGLAMGLTSLIIGWTMPASPVSLIFRNPLVSVLPRALIGFAALGANRLVKYLLRNRPQRRTVETTAAVAAGIAAVVTNTTMVALMTLAAYYGQVMGVDELFGGNTSDVINWTLIGGFFAFNFAVELTVNAVMNAPIVSAIKHALRMPFGYTGRANSGAATGGTAEDLSADGEAADGIGKQESLSGAATGGTAADLSADTEPAGDKYK